MNTIRQRGDHPGRRHHHPGGRGRPPFDDVGVGHRHPRRPGRGRAPRGDVRTAVLLLLAEQPMHGYQLMQEIRRRTHDQWRPSPGSIYPILQQLEDEGLVRTAESGGRRSRGRPRAAARTRESSAGRRDRDAASA